MSTTIHASTFDTIQVIRDSLVAEVSIASTFTDAAQRFVERLAAEFSTIALARMFLVRKLSMLPHDDQRAAMEFARAAGRSANLAPETPTLCLMGSTGREESWQRRETSADHRAIPLIDKQLVDGAPMIAALLASLNLSLANLENNSGVQLRNLAGGLNARFYVPDARSTTDAAGRHIIASQEFVRKYGVKTVFGMGGSYVEGALVVAILFSTELLDTLHVDRFPALIGSFKIATSHLIATNTLAPAG